MNSVGEMDMEISASIVTYNNQNEIRGVLDSLINSSCIDSMQIYVVDNCSQDDTINIVNKEYPSVTVIHSPKNGGYGFGHNQAIKITNAKYHFVINPDILFDTSLIERIVEFLDTHEDIVLAIPAVYDEAGILKYPPKRNPRVRYLLSRFLPNNKLTNSWREEYEMRHQCDKDEEYLEIEVCSGSFMSMRMDAVRKIGGFDERYFMYFEDMDISRQLSRFGRIVCMKHFKVVHEGKRAAHHSNNAKKMMLDSMIKYFNKWGWRF